MMVPPDGSGFRVHRQLIVESPFDSPFDTHSMELMAGLRTRSGQVFMPKLSSMLEGFGDLIEQRLNLLKISFQRPRQMI
jgi:hypothetical protein